MKGRSRCCEVVGLKVGSRVEMEVVKKSLESRLWQGLSYVQLYLHNQVHFDDSPFLTGGGGVLRQGDFE